MLSGKRRGVRAMFVFVPDHCPVECSSTEGVIG